MGETREEFINGFCRTTNESRTVCCEYERQPDGEWTLTDYECNVDKCPNSAACQIYKEAREKENTYEKNNKISVFSIVCRIYNGFL